MGPVAAPSADATAAAPSSAEATPLPAVGDADAADSPLFNTAAIMDELITPTVRAQTPSSQAAYRETRRSCAAELRDLGS